MIFSRSNSREAQDALCKAWNEWCRSNDLSKAKTTPSKDVLSRKRRRTSAVRRALDVNGNGPIAEGVEAPRDDGDLPLSQDGYIPSSQEFFPASQG